VIDSVIGFIVGALLGALIAVCAMQSGWQRHAVDTGHAEFYLDENHNKQWRWK
jgi:hypothetical protein